MKYFPRRRLLMLCWGAIIGLAQPVLGLPWVLVIVAVGLGGLWMGPTAAVLHPSAADIFLPKTVMEGKKMTGKRCC